MDYSEEGLLYRFAPGLLHFVADGEAVRLDRIVGIDFDERKGTIPGSWITDNNWAHSMDSEFLQDAPSLLYAGRKRPGWKTPSASWALARPNMKTISREAYSRSTRRMAA
jgi:hypothetical protein